jgi:cytochrome c-type biogenesis protein CcmF
VFILGLMVIFIGGGLALFAARAGELRQGGLFAPVSREGGLVLNNILLTTACATVLVGTLYPLALESLTGDKISVGPPFFNLTFGPLMLPLLLALPFGPFLAWKRGDLAGAAQRLFVAAAVAVVAIAASAALARRGPWLAPFGIGLGVFVMMGAVAEIAYRIKLGATPWSEALRRLTHLPRSVVGTTLAHFGVGMMVVGIVATSAYQSEQVVAMKPGDRTEIAGYGLVFKGVAPAQGPNYREEIGTFEVTVSGRPLVTLHPSKRVYDQPPQPTSEAGILASWGGDLYTILGDAQQGGGYSVRIYFNPLVRLIWIGAVVMFVAGGISLADRRLRVGAPIRGRRRGGAAPQPAE